MKKILSFILVVVLMLCLVSCQSESSVEIISEDESTNSKFDFLNVEGKVEDSIEERETTGFVSESAGSSDNQTNIVYVTESGTKYHTAGCHHLKKSTIEISKASAIANGYTPCSVCKP